jgi:ubiquinone/menaquinone biosynthesis C-methylase UbiE
MRAALDPGDLRSVYDRAAHRYDLWHGFATARSDQRGRAALVRECVRPGDTVLDAGGGSGSTSRLAAAAVGGDGAVTLLDLSPGMLEVASGRLDRAGLRSRVSIAIGDLSYLPFAERRFDVVLSTYAVCSLVSPSLGAREMYRVLKPGGLLGIAHSAEPTRPFVRRLAGHVEDMLWRWPQLSLGCRPVSVLPTLVEVGCEVVYDRRLGLPLWPFRIIVVRKPPAV